MFYQNYKCILTCRYVYTCMPPTHMHILRRSIISALEGFLIEVSIMTDNSFLVTGMNSNPFLFPLCCDLLLHLQCVGPLMTLGCGVIHLPLLSLFTVWALLVFLKDSVSPLWPEGDSLSVSVFAMFHLPSHFHLLNTHHTCLERKKSSFSLLLCICRDLLLVISNLHSLRMCKGT